MSETEYNYEQEIAYTQGIRKQIITGITEGGVPKDHDSIKVLLSALKDHDTTTLTDRKNRIDESSSQSSADIAAALTTFVNTQNNRNPFERAADGSVQPSGTVTTPVAPIPKVDEAKLGEHDLVQGEEEIGIIAEDSDAFFKRMGVQLNSDTE